MRRRLAAAAAGAIALALSIPLALLGRAALATPAAVARQTAEPPAGDELARRHGSWADRAAWQVLGADRSEPFAQILQIYRTVAALPALAGQPTWSVRIARLIPKLRSPAERAQAYVMAGRVLALGAGDGLGVAQDNDSEGARALLAQAADDFRAAVQDDPESEEAKYDLELVLHQQRAVVRRGDAGARRDPVRARPAPGRRGRAQPLTQSRINDAGVYATGSGY